MLFVTGITGHTGRWFLQKMIEEHYSEPLRVLTRQESDTSLLEKSGLDLEIVRGSLEDKAFLEKAMDGIEMVLHISSILFSENVMEAALKKDVKWAILVHTTGRYSKYKSASEEYIRIEEGILKNRDKIGITILRPTMIYGSSRDRNMYKLVDYLYRHKFFPLFGDGKNLMQPVHAHDLGHAYYAVLKNREKTFNREYNLAGKSPLPYRNLVECVSRELGRKNVIVKVPLSLSVLGARIYNALTKRAVISVEQVLRMQEDKAFDYQDAARDFGYAPLSFEEGIREEVREYLSAAEKNSTAK
jgi:nucleoside-diphosphate-sugar epimerase